MIWIDLENKKPTDTDIPNWKPWSQEQWNQWLAKSVELVQQLAALHNAGDTAGRNALIDANSNHWTKLKPWLSALSHGKCWFSETSNPYFHYDIEHFRPKKEARGLDGDTRDGYWWLAFDYMNFRICGTVGNRKKGGWFPLRTGSLCSTHAERCEDSEASFFLDPINSYDVDLLAFDEEGKAVAVPGASDWEQLRVQETVKRLKLNEHEPLTEARRRVWVKTSNLIEQFQRAKSELNGYNPVAVEKVRSLRRQMKEMMQPTSDLSAVAKWCILLRNDPRLSRLLG
jgi:PHD/YefM family antitoxin component YafN of YafNO toxin-antitoxin module